MLAMENHGRFIFASIDSQGARLKNIFALVALMVCMSAATAANVATKKSRITLLQTTTTMGGLPSKAASNIAQNGKDSKKLGPATMTSSSTCMDETTDYSWCDPEEEDIWFSDRSSWMVEGLNGWPQKLETVVVVGQRTCYVWVNDVWGAGVQAPCDDIDPHAFGGLGKDIVEAAVDVGERAVEYAVPLVQKCITTTTLNPIKSPDQDEANGWLIARDALLTAFAGNIGALRVGTRFDVRYPSGHVVRLVMGVVGDDPSDLALGRWLVTGVPDPADNQCK